MSDKDKGSKHTPPRPNQDLPEPQPHPDNTLPGDQPYPDNSLPVDQPYPDNSLPGDQPRPDNTLPGDQPRPDNSLPGDQPYPDNSLPGDQPRPDNSLPPHVDNTLPPAGEGPGCTPPSDGDWNICNESGKRRTFKASNVEVTLEVGENIDLKLTADEVLRIVKDGLTVRPHKK